jgi:hypothetical protein
MVSSSELSEFDEGSLLEKEKKKINSGTVHATMMNMKKGLH